MKLFSLNLCIYVAIATYICSFFIAFYVGKYKSQVDDEIYYYIETKSIDFDDDVSFSSSSFERFKQIFINNEKVVIYNYFGALSFGFSSLASLAFNGSTFGNYIGYYSNHISTPIILRYTLPHSFELIAIILSGGEGIYLGIYLLLCLIGRKELKNIDGKLYIHFILCTFIILLAAFVEAYITMLL